jgi:hypothetical protein
LPNGGVVALCNISRFIETSTLGRNSKQGDQMPLLRDIEARLSILRAVLDSRLCIVLCASWKELLAQLHVGRGWGKRAICRLAALSHLAVGSRTDSTIALVQPTKHGWVRYARRTTGDRRMQVKKRYSKGHRADGLRSPLGPIKIPKIQPNAKGEPPSAVSSPGPPYFHTVASSGRHPRLLTKSHLQ